MTPGSMWQDGDTGSEAVRRPGDAPAVLQQARVARPGACPFRRFSRDGDGGSWSIGPGALVSSWDCPCEARIRGAQEAGGKERWGGGQQVRGQHQAAPPLCSGYTHARYSSVFNKCFQSAFTDQSLARAHACSHSALPPTAFDLLTGPEGVLPTDVWAACPCQALSRTRPACLTGWRGCQSTTFNLFGVGSGGRRAFRG